jgi:hypothetical protein
LYFFASNARAPAPRRDDTLIWVEQAAKILYFGLKAPLDAGNPYYNPDSVHSANQAPFLSLGFLDLLTLLGEVAQAAMAVTWHESKGGDAGAQLFCLQTYRSSPQSGTWNCDPDPRHPPHACTWLN